MFQWWDVPSLYEITYRKKKNVIRQLALKTSSCESG